MDSIRGLLDENTLQSIAKAAGKGVTEKQVEDVLNAVLPAIEKDSASGTLVSRPLRFPAGRPTWHPPNGPSSPSGAWRSRRRWRRSR